MQLDRDSFERLVLEHLSAAQRFAIRLTGSVDDAEDVVQEALVRVAKGWKGYRGGSSFRTWMFQVIVNVFRDSISRRRPAESVDVGAVDGNVACDPVASAEGEELREQVARLVSGLPARQREVLVLSAYEGMEVREIASVLAMTEQNVRTNLHLARRRLKERLAKTSPGIGHERR